MACEMYFLETYLDAAVVDEVNETLPMDEESFRAFYAMTARPLWAYLARVLVNAELAEDLFQETYYRFVRVRRPEMDAAERRSYLFRIATNLLRDHWRRSGIRTALMDERVEASRVEHPAETIDRGADVRRLFGLLKPRERALLWMAYVEGLAHKEIADRIGLRVGSVRPMLFRARRKLAELLRSKGLGPLPPAN